METKRSKTIRIHQAIWCNGISIDFVCIVVIIWVCPVWIGTRKYSFERMHAFEHRFRLFFSVQLAENFLRQLLYQKSLCVDCCMYVKLLRLLYSKSIYWVCPRMVLFQIYHEWRPIGSGILVTPENTSN